jgi:hypothetical protein
MLWGSAGLCAIVGPAAVPRARSPVDACARRRTSAVTAPRVDLGLSRRAQRGVLQARPAQVFAFEEIVEAHRLLDAGAAGGKIVVAVG